MVEFTFMYLRNLDIEDRYSKKLSMPTNNCFFVFSIQEKENKILSELMKYVILVCCLLKIVVFFLNKKGWRNQKLKIIFQCDFSTTKTFLPNFSAYVQFHSDQSILHIHCQSQK